MPPYIPSDQPPKNELSSDLSSLPVEPDQRRPQGPSLHYDAYLARFRSETETFLNVFQQNDQMRFGRHTPSASDDLLNYRRLHCGVWEHSRGCPTEMPRSEAQLQSSSWATDFRSALP
jgi:hypothetical protein